MSDLPKKSGALKKTGGASMDRARRTELAVSFVLRFGVGASAAVILLGLGLFALRGAPGAAGGIGAGLDFPHSPGRLWAGLLALDPISIVTLGLILIILTPVARVAVSVLAFATERDWRYVGITVAVLLILCLSFLIGATGG